MSDEFGGFNPDLFRRNFAHRHPELLRMSNQFIMDFIDNDKYLFEGITDDELLSDIIIIKYNNKGLSYDDLMEEYREAIDKYRREKDSKPLRSRPIYSQPEPEPEPEPEPDPEPVRPRPRSIYPQSESKSSEERMQRWREIQTNPELKHVIGESKQSDVGLLRNIKVPDGFNLKRIYGDGNCLFSAVLCADKECSKASEEIEVGQVAGNSEISKLRGEVADWLYENRGRDVGGQTLRQSIEDDSSLKFEEYIQNMRNNVGGAIYGGLMELLAISEIKSSNIRVYMTNNIDGQYRITGSVQSFPPEDPEKYHKTIHLIITDDQDASPHYDVLIPEPDPKVLQLKEMGFDSEAVQRALKNTGEDVQQAATFLLNTAELKPKRTKRRRKKKGPSKKKPSRKHRKPTAKKKKPSKKKRTGRR